jgi:hypothetical protein
MLKPPSDRFVLSKTRPYLVYYIACNGNTYDAEEALKEAYGLFVKQDMIAHAVLAWKDELIRMENNPAEIKYSAEWHEKYRIANSEYHYWESKRKEYNHERNVCNQRHVTCI